MTSKSFEFAIQGGQKARPLTFSADALVCCGWVGRDRAALQAHIDELAHLGVPPPTRAPIYMQFSTYLLTQDEEMPVVSATTSGEVEYVVLRSGNKLWVTVGSDQTDRDVETKSIVASKQMCGKFIARECWPMSDVSDHWDRLVLRCWITKDGRRTVYQDSPLSSILSPAELLENMPEPRPDPSRGLVLYSGTVATKSGLIYGDAYDLELEDPIRQRTLRAAYRVSVMPQHI